MLEMDSYVDRSYLEHRSAREYRDRKMAKWMGFFLSEHTSQLNEYHADLGYEFIPPEQMDMDEIGQNLLEAYQDKKKVEIALNLIADNKFIRMDGFVEGYSGNMVYLDSGSININNIRAVNFYR